MADEGKASGGFWSTLPGILTGIAAVIAAITTAVVAMRSHSGPEPQPPPAAYQAQEQTPTPTPAAKPATATGPMGNLQPGTSYNQGDIYDRPASSAEECSTLCYNDNRCRAMTFIISQQRCWIKDTVTGNVGHSPDMVSALKQIQ